MLASIAEAVRRVCGYKFPPMGPLAHRAILGMLPRIVTVELLPDIRVELDMNDQTERSTYWQGSRFEAPTPQVLRRWAKSQPAATIFFDIGSNYGFFSYWMLTVCPGIEVFAFEPNPHTFAKLEKVKNMNGLVRLHSNNLGLSNQTAVLALHPGEIDSGHSTFGAHPSLCEKTIETAVTSFDRWRKDCRLPLPPVPRWLAKIDVEGFELKVLEGMEASLRAKAFKGVVVEINDFTLNFCGTNPSEVFRFLENRGYVPLDRTPVGKHLPTRKPANAFFQPAEN